MGEILVIGIFGLWLLLSALVYVPVLGKVINRLDVFFLIPAWRFFAPIPGQHDYYILYRDTYEDGTRTQWTEVTPPTQRQWWNMVWHPEKRANKALFDIVRECAILANMEGFVLEVSVPYLSLLNYISCIPRSTSPRFTQFLLMCSRGNFFEEEPEIIYLSRCHEL